MGPAAGSRNAVTDEAGRYTITDLPRSREYKMIRVAQTRRTLSLHQPEGRSSR